MSGLLCLKSSHAWHPLPKGCSFRASAFSGLRKPLLRADFDVLRMHGLPVQMLSDPIGITDTIVILTILPTVIPKLCCIGVAAEVGIDSAGLSLRHSALHCLERWMADEWLLSACRACDNSL
jgi:hypothetical protein